MRKIMLIQKKQNKHIYNYGNFTHKMHIDSVRQAEQMDSICSACVDSIEYFI